MSAYLLYSLLLLSATVLTTTTAAIPDYAVTGSDWVDSPILGETYPSCVEVTSVHPYPNTILNTSYMPQHNSYIFKFTLKFSKPIFIQNRDTTINGYPYDGARTDTKGHYWITITPNAFQFSRLTLPNWHLLYSGTSRRVLEAAFLVRREVLSILR